PRRKLPDHGNILNSPSARTLSWHRAGTEASGPVPAAFRNFLVANTPRVRAGRLPAISLPVWRPVSLPRALPRRPRDAAARDDARSFQLQIQGALGGSSRATWRERAAAAARCHSSSDIP